MNPLDQYLDLYRQNAAQVDAHSTGALNSKRQAALEELDAAAGVKADKRLMMFAPDYGVNLMRVDIPADVAAAFHCGVPNLSTLLGVVVNDAFHASSRLAERLPEGVTFCSLREAAEKYPEIVNAHYGSLAPLTDRAVALNTLLAQDGVFIHIGRGVHMEKPLQLVNIFSSPVPLAGMRRVLIVAEADSEASLLVCDHSRPDSAGCLSSEVVEIVLDRGAKFDYYNIEESSAVTSRCSSLYARQGEGSNLLVNGMTLIAGNTSNSYHIDVDHSHCETVLTGMVIAGGEEQVENRTRVNHLASHCHSSQLFKYVLDDRSKGVFDGTIMVAPKADFTEAYQSNKNLLASTDARMHTEPQLEIYCDEVKCSHGATTGQLDASALFYMRSRGIPEAEARTMLMQAFMADVLDTVRISSLRDRLRLLVEKRFVGQELFCGACAATRNCES